jgi:hypothetical protein
VVTPLSSSLLLGGAAAGATVRALGSNCRTLQVLYTHPTAHDLAKFMEDLLALRVTGRILKVAVDVNTVWSSCAR